MEDSGRVGSAETWLSVVGFEGLYEVSSEGRVRSLSRRIRMAHEATRQHTGCLMTPVIDKDGYPRVILRVDGQHYTRKVHRLVCEAFHGPPSDEAPHVDHIDHDKLNARSVNLRWISQLDNLARRKRYAAKEATNV